METGFFIHQTVLFFTNVQMIISTELKCTVKTKTFIDTFYYDNLYQNTPNLYFSPFLG